MKTWLRTAFALMPQTKAAGADSTQTKSASANTPLIALQLATQARWTPGGYSAMAREGYQRNAVAYRCVRMITEAAASVPLCARRDGQCLEDDPAQLLLDRPNPKHARADFFEAYYNYLLLSGNAYLEAFPPDGETPRALFNLRPDRMKVRPGDDGWPQGWEYRAAGKVRYFVNDPLTGQSLIHHMRQFHPEDDDDPKSSESHVPYYSSGARDDLIQRRYIETFLSYWQEDAGHNPISTVYSGPMVDTSRAHIWCWDARPFPDFPARTNIWVDGPNWRTGHWINGRIGLVGLGDIVSELCLASGTQAPDVSGLLGMVSGYVLDRPMSARAALSPLGIAYDFELVERAGGISFISGITTTSLVIELGNLVYAPEGQTITIKREDTENRLKDVRLTCIDAGRNYQTASVFARDLMAETVRILDVQIPLVLDPAQAKIMASSLLERSLVQMENIEFTVSQTMSPLEVGDIVELGKVNDVWQITSLDGQGTRSAQARKTAQNAALISSGFEPDIAADPIWVSAPHAVILDIPDITGQGLRSGPLVGAVLAPWQPVSITGPNDISTALTVPISIGALLTDLPPGPAGRFWRGGQVDIYLPGALLSSLNTEDVLGGGNMLAVETASGWEVLQCQNAVLVGDDTYRIDGLLRGQHGTDSIASEAITAGARLVKLPLGFQNLPIDTALRGNELNLEVFANGRVQSENAVFTYAANHLRPLSPVHVKAKVQGVNLEITWTRRTRIGGDDWAALNVPLGEEVERYEVDFMDGAAVVLTKQTAVPALDIPILELETHYGAPLGGITIAVYQLSQIYGRGAGVFSAVDI